MPNSTKSSERSTPGGDEPSDAATVWRDAAADPGAAGSDGVTGGEFSEDVMVLWPATVYEDAPGDSPP